MEEKETKKKNKTPKTYYYPNGVKTRLVVPEPEKLSPAGIWRREHPNGIITEIIDMRAVLK
jgi:hypothetical protein